MTSSSLSLGVASVVGPSGEDERLRDRKENVVWWGSWPGVSWWTDGENAVLDARLLHGGRNWVVVAASDPLFDVPFINVWKCGQCNINVFIISLHILNFPLYCRSWNLPTNVIQFWYNEMEKAFKPDTIPEPHFYILMSTPQRDIKPLTYLFVAVLHMTPLSSPNNPNTGDWEDHSKLSLPIGEFAYLWRLHKYISPKRVLLLTHAVLW